ncbi:MoxR family ATPase [Labedella populi]|uniref:MoxR family ATPase n=1 Tax=Labedella populi TaxID=2498850 RepID=A0A444QAW0_9MICO|nr:MoxR family ATPase [Labedella populi]
MTDTSTHRREPRTDAPRALTFDEVHVLASRITRTMESVISGKPDAVQMALTVVLAGGHLLLEDVPGVGKTMLARALGTTVGSRVNRIQFTPDLLPSDVTGVSVYNQVERRFEFSPGPIFANIVIGDEINRASPKTQSALLESMEERQVTVDGTTYPLAKPFTVVATQNPIEMEGTYALPEAQRDRFMARISMGYPSADAEVSMLTRRESANPLDTITAVVTNDELVAMIDAVGSVYVSPAVTHYAVEIARATRSHPDLRLGASPRSTLQLVRAARALAVIDGYEFVLPDHVDRLVRPVFGHRLVATSRALGHSGDSEALISDLLDDVVSATPVPAIAPARH